MREEERAGIAGVREEEWGKNSRDEGGGVGQEEEWGRKRSGAGRGVKQEEETHVCQDS